MTAPSLQDGADRVRADMVSIARFGDVVLLLSLAVSAAASMAIGQWYGDLATALAIGGGLLAAGALAFALARGTIAGWAALTMCNVAMVALHIQLSRGTIEFHFGVFVLLGLLLVYRDPRPILLAAVLFAVHHVAFDRLQALGLGVYCTTAPDLLRMVMHAAYVVVQTGVEVFLAVRMRHAAIESAELQSLVAMIDRGDVVCLAVKGFGVRTAAARSLQSAIGKVATAMGEVSHAATSIESASTAIAAGSIDLSQRTEEQASSLQQTAASMEELSGTVSQTTEAAHEATRVSNAASCAAVEGGGAVREVATTMSGIAESSRRIADINGVIDGIAFQTNILALNAAVEAARAGEQGRGFAVVASEVRLLAQRSATAAKEIKTLIGDSVERVELGSRQVVSAEASMGAIVDQTARVTQLIAGISTASTQQSTGISQVGEAVVQLDVVTQQNAALVEQSTAASQSLKQQAIRLNSIVQRFALAD